VRRAFAGIGRQSIGIEFATVLLRGIFAGWLIALLVWMRPFAETARFFVIVAITWIIGIAGRSHAVAGAVGVLFLATTGAAPGMQAVGGSLCLRCSVTFSGTSPWWPSSITRR
jgi:formate/nitrite transporter FocA (FNT family)